MIFGVLNASELEINFDGVIAGYWEDARNRGGISRQCPHPPGAPSLQVGRLRGGLEPSSTGLLSVVIRQARPVHLH